MFLFVFFGALLFGRCAVVADDFCFWNFNKLQHIKKRILAVL